MEDFDVQMAVDHLTDANTGFIYVLSNKRTIILFKFWYGTRDIQLGIHEQDNFQKMLEDKSIQDIGLKLRFLDVNIFSGYCQVWKGGIIPICFKDIILPLFSLD